MLRARRPARRRPTVKASATPLGDVDALDRDAELARRGEAGVGGVRRGLLRVDVVEHDERVLAAEFERGADQAARGALAPRSGRSRSSR